MNLIKKNNFKFQSLFYKPILKLNKIFNRNDSLNSENSNFKNNKNFNSHRDISINNDMNIINIIRNKRYKSHKILNRKLYLNKYFEKNKKPKTIKIENNNNCNNTIKKTKTYYNFLKTNGITYSEKMYIRNKLNKNFSFNHILNKKNIDNKNIINIPYNYGLSLNTLLNNYNKNKVIKNNKHKFFHFNYSLKQIIKEPYLEPNYIKENNKMLLKLNKNLSSTDLKNNNNKIKQLHSFNLLIKNKETIDTKYKLFQIKNNFLSKDLISIIKFKLIFQLMNKYFSIINDLFKIYDNIKNFFNKHKLMNKKEFLKLIKIIEIQSLHQNINYFIDEVFLIFQIQNNNNEINENIIDIKDFFFHLIVCNNFLSYKQKIEFLLKIIEENNNKIYILEILKYIQNSLYKIKDYLFIKNLLYKNINKKILEKNDLLIIFIENKELRKLYEKNILLNEEEIDKNYKYKIKNFIMNHIKNHEINSIYNKSNILYMNDIKKIELILLDIFHSYIKKIKLENQNFI